MFIKNLKIINTVDDLIIRDVNFHIGANFIRDAKDSEQHNKVGKTTFLKLIDVALGAKDKKLIYIDPETNSIEETLQEIITNKRMAVELIVVDNLKKPTIFHTLHVDLFPRGSYKINGNSLNQSKYKENLNEIFFKNTTQAPTFRQLIKSFVRISMDSDNNSFLRNLPRTSNADYRAVYNYLFHISDPRIDLRRGQLKKELISLKNAEKQFKRVQNTQEPAEIEQVISVLKNDKAEIQNKLNDIISSEDFQKNRENISKVRQQYTSLSSDLSDVRFKQQQNELMLQELTAKDSLSIKLDLTSEFFDEINNLVPSLNKTFNDLVKFNSKLQKNKTLYLQEVQETLNKQVHELTSERESLVQGNNTLISLVAKNRLDEYNNLLSNLSEREQEISTRQQMLKTVNNFSEDRKRIEESIKSLDNNHDTGSSDYYLTKMDNFNKIFTKFASHINGERPVLTYNPDENKFPISITDLDGTSTGTLKSLIAAYDLAYQKFASLENISVPNFVIHDVIENIEGQNLKNIISIANDINTQFIVAVLEEKLTSSQLSEKKQLELIHLAKDDKLFEPKDLQRKMD
ncbi:MULTISPECIES: DUF2326 domain-containing protein [Leuconostoc gelidum group]|uniref:DUF2326 domain-containing protein n=1 Tax=Leuconostoc gelidum group TaxID=3016637 RepID=UPI00027E6C54|nr:MULTISPECIES: DUF2326 domain-containing protein [Leuconostoc gelidum group]AFS40247.1 hypothetical protein C269_04020 [Leuconostoc gelidum JB7]MBZ5948026.1 DUF2326 domain-containing protein [Leuconostoc gasicomitatum]MBZ5988183.1 DUF2326 domain-containing protein [Leuconostoc gasicomitatum]MBZ5990150.1 DUF2326 domain-containing protein [Leuconostoc gasicomitatum]